MFTFPTWDTGWAEVFAAMMFALVIGKALRQESRVLMLALIGAVLTDSWVGVFVAPVLSMSVWVLDLIRKVGG